MFKSLLCIVCFFVLAQIVVSQRFSPPTTLHHKKVQNDSINQYNENGDRTGFWTDHFPNGNPRYEGNFEDGRPIGKFKYFFPEGGLRAELIHIDDEKTVQATFYHRRRNNNTMSEGQYVDQKKHGLWRFFNNRGDLVMKNYFHYDENHGVWKTFYRSGLIMEIVTYHYGEKKGEWKQYYENGQVRISANYENDLLNGKYIMYYENGNKMIDGYFHNNLEHKRWTHIAHNGEIEKIIVYDEGEVVEENIFIEREDVDKPPIRPGNDPYEEIFEGLF